MQFSLVASAALLSPGDPEEQDMQSQKKANLLTKDTNQEQVPLLAQKDLILTKKMDALGNGIEINAKSVLSSTEKFAQHMKPFAGQSLQEPSRDQTHVPSAALLASQMDIITKDTRKSFSLTLNGFAVTVIVTNND